MLKLEKIIILFSLLYSIKSFNLNSTNLNSKFKNRKSSCLANANSVRIKNFNIFLSSRFYFFITSDLMSKDTTFKNKMHFCFKLQFRIIVVSIYFKKTLLFNVFKSLKKKVRTRKRIERLYKRKGLVYGVKKIVRWNKYIHEKNIRRKKMVKKLRKSFYKFVFKSFLKFVYAYKINVVNICFFKSNKYIKKKGFRRLYLKKKSKRIKRIILKKVKKLFFLKFFKNIKFNIVFSNNFSHSKKFIKLKKKKS